MNLAYHYMLLEMAEHSHFILSEHKVILRTSLITLSVSIVISGQAELIETHILKHADSSIIE